MMSRLALGFLLAGLTLWGQQHPVPQFVTVPAGEFSMGSAEGAAWERPPHAVETPAFEISARPVSNREFQAFRPEHRSPGDESPDAPVTGVTWSDAEAYCRWLQDRLGTGVTLPSEARWERAARGGLEQQTYPWGEEYAPAASLSASALRPNGYGVYAVAYNLWEWTADWYAPDYFSKSPRKDPAGPSSGDFRVLRGGGFRSDPASATCYSRGSARPTTSSPYITFRVMKTGAEPAKEVTQSPAPAPPTRPADVAAAAPPPTPASGLGVTAVTFEQSGGELRIQLATTGKPAYRDFALTSPDRLVIDLQGTVQRISKGSGAVPVEQAGVKQIRYSQFQMDPPVTRIVIDLDRALKRQVEASDRQLLIRLSPGN
jgi:hypothetical protein